MQKIAIVTDSTACLTRELAHEYGIEIVPYELVFEGRVYRDGIDDPGDFYNLLRATKHLPTTAAPAPGLFLEAFRRASDRAHTVLCITLPSSLSSAHNSSEQAIALAKTELPHVEIISVPAPAVAAGQGLVVLEAAEMASRGLTLRQVLEKVPVIARNVHFYAVLDNLEYLAKGGHVPKAAAWLGDLAHVKPILTARDGRVERLSQVRSKTKGYKKMIELMETENPDGHPIRALLMQADAINEAQRFSQQIQARFICEHISIAQFSPVMGVHSGPGVVGVAFLTLRPDD